jgi:anhydro-N-acetylmuramic acid kinase
MAASGPGERYVGLISGTSMDGIDAVLADFTTGSLRVEAALTLPFEDTLRAELDAVRRDPDAFPVARLCHLDAALGDELGRAALAVAEKAGHRPEAIRAIGSHGQTIVHHAEAEPPFTLQIGDPWRLCRRTGITTVADFRRADLAAGGQGAPLAPLLHEALFAHPREPRFVANLGGIANLTVLAPGEPVAGYDTGPANCLLDLWYRRHHDDERFDPGGRWAASGRVDQAWLKALLRDPYLAAPAPKSTGIEYYNPAWLDARLPPWSGERPADVQATLAAFSASTLATAVGEAAGEEGGRLLICGGGVHNDDMIGRLKRHLPRLAVESTAEHGLDPDHVEAALFAWLARRRLAGERIDTRSVTGAARDVIAGAVFEP